MIHSHHFFSIHICQLIHSAIFGVINTIIAVPSMVGYSAIIYRDPFFSQPENLHVMPSLLKLVLLSSAIHQLSFIRLSSMPFAVAQVQDAGLIFLSSMSAMIIAAMLAEGVTDSADIIATVVVSLSACTGALGLVLIVIGKLKLAGK
jgi:SulP family sulfate permease